MSRRSRPAVLLAALVALAALALAACSGGDDDDAAPTTTARATTTTERTTTTTAPPVGQLTGLPLDDPLIGFRPALVVKIDNHPDAVPQSGLAQADLVFEEIVEGITRFAAVFHSTGSDPVGPIRSARTTDVQLLPQLGRPLLAWSGGNPGVTGAVAGSPLVDVGVNAFPDLYFRDRSRRAPHNLYSSTSELWAVAPPEATPPPPLFQYRGDGEALPAGAEPVTGVDIEFTGGQRVAYGWDDQRGRWLRFQQGEPHLDVDGQQLAPENVVIQFVDYGASPADPRSPEARTVGEGEAWVLTDGHLIRGRWVRPSPEQVTQLLDAAGQPIRLTPGRTWVALPEPGDATVVPPLAPADPAGGSQGAGS
ncbi:MAG: DUF3048 domain-containing protein [Acidimicrobiales bacterium]|nr:DUF3048 domain-containing protein [Acidimicrobiales bacterium]